jgi:hypothetical protein
MKIIPKNYNFTSLECYTQYKLEIKNKQAQINILRNAQLNEMNLSREQLGIILDDLGMTLAHHPKWWNCRAFRQSGCELCAIKHCADRDTHHFDFEGCPGCHHTQDGPNRW